MLPNQCIYRKNPSATQAMAETMVSPYTALLPQQPEAAVVWSACPWLWDLGNAPGGFLGSPHPPCG